jgi:glucokinase
MICITLGTGVGGGIILNGKLWRGAHGAAAEVGHMAVVGFDGVECGCGSRGCLEVYASATAVVRMAREAKPRHPDSMLDTGENLTSEKVYLAAVNGDELSLDVFRQMGAYLGVGVANLINVIDPEVVVIGGGLSNGWDLFAEHVQREVSNRAFPVPARAVKILRAECGDDAGLLGAAYIAFNNPPHV